MNQAFKECLKHKKIIPFPRAKGLAKKELAAAKEDLIEAKDRFHNSRYKYSTIIAYYAAFHAARALLYSRGYRERSHYCLLIALETLFVETGLMVKRARYLSEYQELCSIVFWCFTKILRLELTSISPYDIRK